MNKRLLVAAVLTLAAGGMASMAHAADATDATGDHHPRVNEINKRIDNQQARETKGVENGTITGKQAEHDEKVDAKIQEKATADEAKNGGHLTKPEQKNLNKRLNKNSKRIHKQAAKPDAKAGVKADATTSTTPPVNQ